MPAAEVHAFQRDDADMTGRRTWGTMRFLVGAACIVIISWGISAASNVISLVLFGFLLAYSALPFVKWLMHRFQLRKAVALTFVVGLMGTLAVVLVFLLYENVASAKEKLPIYEEHARDLYQHVAGFLIAHGIDITGFSATKLSSSNEIVGLADQMLSELGSFFSNGMVVVVLGGILLSMIAEDKQRVGARSIFIQVQGDVAHYIGAAAATGVLTAIANLVLLAALGVDFPLVWCVLYFFLNFIPNIGFVLSLVPPGFLALLMLGWKKALLVVAGLLLTQLISKYAIGPMFLRKEGVSVSSMEKTLSLLWWGFLLGPAGGILAIPLTLAMKRFIPNLFGESSYATAPSE